jgi:hypothetical protein
MVMTMTMTMMIEEEAERRAEVRCDGLSGQVAVGDFCGARNQVFRLLEAVSFRPGKTLMRCMWGCDIQSHPCSHAMPLSA